MKNLSTTLNEMAGVERSQIEIKNNAKFAWMVYFEDDGLVEVEYANTEDEYREYYSLDEASDKQVESIFKLKPGETYNDKRNGMMFTRIQ